MSELRYTAFHRVLHRPNLIMGCDRELVLVLLLLCTGTLVTAQNMVATMASIVIVMFGVPLLRKMAKADPKMRQIYIRQLKYQSFYPARSRAFRKDR